MLSVLKCERNKITEYRGFERSSHVLYGGFVTRGEFSTQNANKDFFELLLKNFIQFLHFFNNVSNEKFLQNKKFLLFAGGPSSFFCIFDDGPIVFLIGSS